MKEEPLTKEDVWTLVDLWNSIPGNDIKDLASQELILKKDMVSALAWAKKEMYKTCKHTTLDFSACYDCLLLIIKVEKAFGQVKE